jgi:hypothetical protein
LDPFYESKNFSCLPNCNAYYLVFIKKYTCSHLRKNVEKPVFEKFFKFYTPRLPKKSKHTQNRWRFYFLFFNLLTTTKSIKFIKTYVFVLVLCAKQQQNKIEISFASSYASNAMFEPWIKHRFTKLKNQ